MTGTDQGDADRRAHRPAQAAEGVRGDAAEQRPGLRRVPAARQHRRRHRRRQPEAQQPDRVAGQVQDRAQQIVDEQVEGLRRPPEAPPPAAPVGAQPLRRRLDRAQHHPGGAVVERMREVDLGPEPLEPMALEAQRAQERRADRHRVDGRAVVVHKPRDGELPAARPAPDRLGGLEHGDRDPLPGERHRAREPIRAGADDDRLAHAVVTGLAGRSRPRVTSTGNSQDSSSQGPRLTISATSTQPSSSRPEAAS